MSNRFRLLLMFPFFIFSTMGWFGWAISAHLKEPWIGPTIFYSLLNFAQAISSIALVVHSRNVLYVYTKCKHLYRSISYVVDAHSNYAPESFGTIK